MTLEQAIDELTIANYQQEQLAHHRDNLKRIQAKKRSAKEQELLVQLVNALSGELI